MTPMTERVHLFGNETTEVNDELGSQHVVIVCNVGYVPWPPEPLILRTPWCKADGNFTRAVSCRSVLITNPLCSTNLSDIQQVVSKFYNLATVLLIVRSSVIILDSFAIQAAG